MNPEVTQFRNEPFSPATQRMPSGSIKPTQDFLDYLKAYARERPEAAALWCFGIGFVVGWKLKPW